MNIFIKLTKELMTMILRIIKEKTFLENYKILKINYLCIYMIIFALKN